MTKTCSCVTDAPCLSHQNHQQLMDIHGAVYIKRNTWFKPQHPYFVCLRYAVSLRPHLLCTSLTSIVYPTIPLRSVCIVGFAFRSQHPNLDNGLINDSNFMRKHMRYYYTALMRFKVLYVDGGFHRPVGDTDVSTSTNRYRHHRSNEFIRLSTVDLFFVKINVIHVTLKGELGMIDGPTRSPRGELV